MHGFRCLMLLWVCVLFPAFPLVAGDDVCLDCHADMEDLTMTTMHTPEREVGCVDCHGSTPQHLDDPSPENISLGVGAAGVRTCLNCHDDDSHRGSQWTDLHQRSDVSCSDCHRMHGEHPKPRLLAENQVNLCLSCHQAVKAMLDKPYGHHMAHGGLECSDCHNPHGGAGNKRFTKGSRISDTCTSCHPTQRGPFAFPHVAGSEGDCLTCHEAHGSANPRHLTRNRVDRLCLECHSTQPAGTLGSQPPSTHNLRLPRYQNCLTCHTAVHGSSSHPSLLK